MDKIICLGKNYLEHSKELGEEVPDKPVIFLKPPSVLIQSQKADEKVVARLPQNRGEVHPECEIVFRISKKGFHIKKVNVREYVSHMTLGLDMTLRDEQWALKKKGHPWTTAKVFPDSAIVGPWSEIKWMDEWKKMPFSFSVDGTPRQSGLATEMMCSWEECVCYASQFFELCPGDILFTGTPKGVAPVNSGQTGELRWGKVQFSVSWIPLKS